MTMLNIAWILNSWKTATLKEILPACSRNQLTAKNYPSPLVWDKIRDATMFTYDKAKFPFFAS